VQQSATRHELICAWLHLPAGSWPPDHYTLLGLERGESNLRRIEEQAGSRMQQVRHYQLSYPDQATEAMNRLAQALVCLTDPEARRAYDARLVPRTVRAGGRSAPPPAEEDRTPAPVGTLPWPGLNGSELRVPLAEPGRPRLPGWVMLAYSLGLACVLGGLALAGLWAWTATHPPGPPPSAPDASATKALLPLEVHRVTGHLGTIRSTAFSPEGRLVLLADEQAVRLLNLDTDTGSTAVEPLVGSATGLAFAPKGERFLASDGKYVYLYAVGKQKPLRFLDGHEEPVTCVAFSPDGSRALAGAEDGAVLLWECATHAEPLRLLRHTAAVTCVAFSADGRRVLSAGKDHKLRLWNVQTGQPLSTLLGGALEFNSVALSPDGRRIVSADGTAVHLYEETASGWQARLLDGQPGHITSLALAPDGRRALAGTEEGTIALWDVDNGRELGRCAGHPNAVLSVAFAPDGRRALSGGQDGTVRVWKLP
jgi:hypothetical protein